MSENQFETSQPPQRAARCKCSCGGAKLLMLAIVAAFAGFVITANWQDVVVSLVWTSNTMKLGIVILGAIALGFVLGFLFAVNSMSATGDTEDLEG